MPATRPSQKKRNMNNALQRLDLIMRIEEEGGDDIEGVKERLETLSDDTSNTDDFDVGGTEMSLSQMVYETLSEHKPLKATSKKGKVSEIMEEEDEEEEEEELESSFHGDTSSSESDEITPSLPKFTRYFKPPPQSEKYLETNNSNSLLSLTSKLDKRVDGIRNRRNIRGGPRSPQSSSPTRDDTKKALLQNMIDSMESKALSSSVHSDFGSCGDRFAESASFADISSHSTGALKKKKKKQHPHQKKKNQSTKSNMNVKLFFDAGSESC